MWLTLRSSFVVVKVCVISTAQALGCCLGKDDDLRRVIELYNGIVK